MFLGNHGHKYGTRCPTPVSPVFEGSIWSFNAFSRKSDQGCPEWGKYQTREQKLGEVHKKLLFTWETLNENSGADRLMHILMNAFWAVIQTSVSNDNLRVEPIPIPRVVGIGHEHQWSVFLNLAKYLFSLSPLWPYDHALFSCEFRKQKVSHYSLPKKKAVRFDLRHCNTVWKETKTTPWCIRTRETTRSVRKGPLRARAHRSLWSK